MEIRHNIADRYNRRRFLTHAAALVTTLQWQRAARAIGFPAAATVCTLAAEQEVGPYYVADELLRSHIAEDKPGIPLQLSLAILDVRTCRPLRDAAVDIWHCDSGGVYSGFTRQMPPGPGGPGGPDGPGGFGGPPPGPPPGFDPGQAGHNGPPDGMGPPPAPHPTDKLTFLRGIQLTTAEGRVDFTTVFPGFYPGRTNHIHFKVRLDGHTASRSGSKARTYAAGHTAHTGQVFFPEKLAASLMQNEPYRSHTIHRTTQAEDGVFNGQHGDASIVEVQLLDPANPAAGLRAHLIASVDPTATPAPPQRGFGPVGPPPQGR